MNESDFNKGPKVSECTKLVISQPKRGYRFTSDSVALSEFIRIDERESLLDLGTGVGVIPLLVWQRSPFRFALGIELQKELADLAQDNIRANALSGKIFIIQTDIRSLAPKGISLPIQPHRDNRFDVVASNPPYLGLGRGRINPNHQKALARHEIELTFEELVLASRRFLKPKGRFYFVHRVDREAEVILTLRDRDFTIYAKQYIAGAGRKALFLAEARMGAG